MGLVQLGRSRTWVDDHEWWLCVVEFQPSSWSKGSYLNVGAMWLWHKDHDYIYFAVGHRVEDYVEFKSEEQFAPEARRLADVAAREVLRYRKLFSDMKATAAFLDARTDGSNPHHDALDAGIAWGMVGKLENAARSFERAHLIIERYWEDWVRAVSARSDEERALARAQGIFYPEPSEGPEYRARLNEDHEHIARFQSLLFHPDSFRSEIQAAIDSVREKLRLPAS